jgi:hypothetical protein
LGGKPHMIMVPATKTLPQTSIQREQDAGFELQLFGRDR